MGEEERGRKISVKKLMIVDDDRKKIIQGGKLEEDERSK